MIISHRLDYIFIHIPKCAGSSLRKVLTENPIFKPDIFPTWHTKRRISWEKEYPNVDTNLWTHSSALDIKNYLSSRGYRWDDYFKFAFIRNPWERAVSQYEYFQQRVYKNDNATDFSKKIADQAMHLPPKEFITQRDASNWSISKYLCDENDNIIVDFIGRVENLEEDFEKVVKKILPDATRDMWTIPHENKTVKNKSYRDYYDEETQEFIRNREAKIIELGGYEF